MLPDATATANVLAVVRENGKMLLKLDHQTLELVVRKSESLASRMLNTLIYSYVLHVLLLMTTARDSRLRSPVPLCTSLAT